MSEDADATEFDWDGGNAEKNWIRHGVSQSESEQVFFNRPLVVTEDELHSHEEVRYYALGRTDRGRFLAIVYTFRGEKIRIISARDMSPREQKEYEHARTQEFEADPKV